MKLTRYTLALTLSFSLSLLTFLALPTTSALAQDGKVALQRGYRTGYSDGYMAGYRDSIDNESKSYTRHGEYGKADRAYNKDYGTLENYKDGYKQGFESGYETGFGKRSFEATIPANISYRGNVAVQPKPVEDAVAGLPVQQPEPVSEPVVKARVAEETVAGSVAAPPVEPVAQPEPRSGSVMQNASFTQDDAPIIIIPTDTELIIELDEEISTETSKVGDKFTAKIVSPTEIAGAIVEGRIDKIEKPGRIKKRSELLLSFDRIILSERRWSNFNAILTEVLPIKGDNVKLVDDEGTAIGKSRVKGDSVKIGGATGTGLVIGAIAGGPVGAAVGAGVGAAFGVGSVVIERGKHIHLNGRQQLRIKTAYETQIR